METVIFKENGIFKFTNEENYKRTIRNAREIYDCKDFCSVEDIINYLMQYCGYNKTDFIVVD